MPKRLSRRQIDRFHERGFVAPIAVMSEEEAGEYAERLRLAERRFACELNAQNRNNAHLTFKFLDELVHHPVILDAVEDLIGANFSLWGSVLFIKEPHSRDYVSWHQDATYFGIEPHDFVTPWLALTPSNLESGCMRMIPGSHLESIHAHRDTFGEDNILTRGQEIPEVDESRAVDLVLKPGQMSIHHAKAIHGSRPNRSGRRRIGLAIQSYMPKGARQTIGANYWLPMRGDCSQPDFIHLHRPVQDMDPAAAGERDKVNRNWADILYRGAHKQRAY